MGICPDHGHLPAGAGEQVHELDLGAGKGMGMAAPHPGANREGEFTNKPLGENRSEEFMIFHSHVGMWKQFSAEN